MGKSQYRQTMQYAKPAENSPKIDADGIKQIQIFLWTLLYYDCTINSTTLMAIYAISAAQANVTTATASAVAWSLDYSATYPDATVRYEASQMILRIHSDEYYQLETEYRSRAGGHCFWGSPNYNDNKENNGAIHTTCEITKNVILAASEAKCGAIVINCKSAVPLQITLDETEHPHPPTPTQIENSTTEVIMNSTIQQKLSKVMEMRFYWVQDRTKQKQFNVFWKPGSTSFGYYHTKHHALIHHHNVRTHYINCLGVPRQSFARVC